MPQYPLRHVHDLATSVLQKIEPFDDSLQLKRGVLAGGNVSRASFTVEPSCKDIKDQKPGHISPGTYPREIQAKSSEALESLIGKIDHAWDLCHGHNIRHHSRHHILIGDGKEVE